MFDVDGVLSDAVGRQHFIERGRRDWDAFFNACGDDPIIGEVVAFSSSSTPGCRSFCSPAGPCGSSPRHWPGWSATGCAGTCSSCGPAGDYSQVTWFKRDSVEELRAFGFDLRLAFEDDPNNFAMFHAEGIPCVYIHSGYYD